VTGQGPDYLDRSPEVEIDCTALGEDLEKEFPDLAGAAEETKC
jgi:hypothetical protein